MQVRITKNPDLCDASKCHCCKRIGERVIEDPAHSDINKVVTFLSLLSSTRKCNMDGILIIVRYPNTFFYVLIWNKWHCNETGNALCHSAVDPWKLMINVPFTFNSLVTWINQTNTTGFILITSVQSLDNVDFCFQIFVLIV